MRNIRLLYLERISRVCLLPCTFLVLLALFVLSSYAFLAFKDFSQFKTHVDPSVSLTLDRFHYLLRNRLRQDIFRMTAPPVSETSSLETYRITVDSRDIAQLNSNLPASGKDQYVPAYLRINNEETPRKIKLRYRGKILFHWLYEKKSLRIKTRKEQLIHSARSFNLVVLPHKSTLVECVNYALSREVGLISPDYFPVRVFINGRYMGVYMFLSQVDESLLRKEKRMPGSIYSGEALPRKDGSNPLWEEEQSWKKMSARNSESSADRSDIALFLEGITQTDQQKFSTFYVTFINEPQVMTFLALDSLFGTWHHDLTHNHRIYFDPYKGRFEWTQWDLRYWSLSRDEKDLVLHPLLRQIKLNPLLEAAKDKKLYELLQRYPAETLGKRLDYWFKLAETDFAADALRRDGNYDAPFPEGYANTFSMAEFASELEYRKTMLEERERMLLRLLANVNIKYHFQRLTDDLAYLTIGIAGNSPVQLALGDLLTRKNSALHIYRDINANRQLDDADRLVAPGTEEIFYPGRKAVAGNAMGKTSPKSRMLMGEDRMVAVPLYYSYLVDGLMGATPDWNVMGTNVITGTSVEVSPSKFNGEDVSVFIKKVQSDSIHPWQLAAQKFRRVSFSGDVVVTESMVFDPRTEITIEPGTRFLLGPGVSLFFYGKVIALGERDHPVQFISSTPDEPWGAIVLQGQSTAGSIFRNTVFRGGSTAQRNLIYYPGQLNIHDTEGIILEGCLFSDNNMGDDNLHLAYTEARVEACTFIRSHRDALDADISRLTLRRSVFLESGNDSLDLMTTEANIHRSVFNGSKDKGISIGERSHVSLENSRIQNSNVGLAVKDGSVANLAMVHIATSQTTAVSLYNKIYHYGSGGIMSGSELFVTGEEAIHADARSDNQLHPMFQPPPKELSATLDHIRQEAETRWHLYW